MLNGRGPVGDSGSGNISAAGGAGYGAGGGAGGALYLGNGSVLIYSGGRGADGVIYLEMIYPGKVTNSFSHQPNTQLRWRVIIILGTHWPL